MAATSSWVPTRKWFSAAITGVLTIAGQAIATGAWDTTEWGALVTLGIALTGAYFVPNVDEPGGYPQSVSR
jgi:hypothetical protein